MITARGGSKRIPRKNVRAMSGRPLLTWPVAAALESGAFDEVIVTTDDEQIAEVARAAGATVPFMRPVELSDDWTPTIPVVAHAIREMSALGADFDLTCCLYPAAIFLSPDDIRAARDRLLADPSADYVVTVTEFPMHPELALNLDSHDHLSFVTPEHYGQRTQDMPTRYHDVGQLYWGRTSSWLRGEPVFNSAIGYPLPKWRAQDIDTEDDWARAQMLHTMWLADDQRRQGGDT